MLTLAGVPAMCPDLAVKAALDQRIALAGFLPWADTFPSGDLSYTPAPPPDRAPPDVRCNVLSWPSGASRPAIGYYLLDAAAAFQVEAATQGGAKPIPLFIGFKTGGEDLTTAVTVLRWLPLAQLVQAAPTADPLTTDPLLGPTPTASPTSSVLRNAYLCMVVDDRWRWNQVGCPDFAITPTADPPVSWADCFDALAGALGIAIQRDDIDAVYLVPDESLNLEGEPAGLVLDALAANVGCRIARSFDGTVRLMTYAAALAARQADEQGHASRPLRGGGDGLDEPS